MATLAAAAAASTDGDLPRRVLVQDQTIPTSGKMDILQGYGMKEW